MIRSRALGLAVPLLLTLACGEAPLQPASEKQALSAGLVLSQIYGGGGNSTAAFNNDFVELHNTGAVSVSVAGWSVQYASAAGTSFSTVLLPDASIPAGGYFLIGLAAGGASDAGVLPTPDMTWSTNLAASAGKVALVSATTTLVADGGCGFVANANVIDFVGYGSSASCFEGAFAPGTSANLLATTRKVSGCQETDSNAADFEMLAANPRNSGTGVFVCGTDGGAADSGAADAGSSDAGTADAGTADAGTADAGTADAGAVDAGAVDSGSGTSDAGAVDAGVPDAGAVDSGAIDAGAKPDAGVDAGKPPDAGSPDAGIVDAGKAPDAGAVDSGTPEADSGVPPVEEPPPFDPSIIPKTDAGTGGSGGNRGCGCDASSTLTALLAFALPVLRNRRRRPSR